MSLGYERIINDKRITIQVDDPDDPRVTLKLQGCSEVVRFKASSEADVVATSEAPEFQNEIKYIFDAVHQAYLDSTRESFSCYNA